MQVYENIRSYIEETGLRRKDIAEKAGIAETVFTEILNGERILYAEDLKDICMALNVSPELFIGIRDIDNHKERRCKGNG